MVASVRILLSILYEMRNSICKILRCFAIISHRLRYSITNDNSILNRSIGGCYRLKKDFKITASVIVLLMELVIRGFPKFTCQICQICWIDYIKEN